VQFCHAAISLNVCLPDLVDRGLKRRQVKPLAASLLDALDYDSSDDSDFEVGDASGKPQRGLTNSFLTRPFFHCCFLHIVHSFMLGNCVMSSYFLFSYFAIKGTQYLYITYYIGM